MPHPNARLTVHGRRLLIDRVRAGRPVAHVADEMGISRATAHKWVRRWRAEGDAGLYDRSSRPLTTPHRTPTCVENRICELRRERKLGPARIGPILGMPASTVHRVLTRHQLNRLRWVERLNRTLLNEWAYVRPYSSNAERTEARADFLHTYNYHRCHTALGGQPPISRVNDPAGQYT
ncbi:helix-turn-helix domain-containing protein [Streptomyces phaeochromogenes]|uniref:helix-turn-helix domain-containing protein n=1 Tax=Streptomyces phaeochromogenes TaxID=1923 RepID=UPI002DDBFE90|nr:leucine zipper domain-containing protein [Streptomyces phaeochromogenes]WRZ26367.1 leucine zipper domain-containing protein [Streptomyces phaeochromogenes]